MKRVMKAIPINAFDQLLQKPDCTSKHFHQPTSVHTLVQVDAMKMLIKVLRMLIQRAPSIRVVFGEDPKEIYQMLSLLSKVYDDFQPDVQEDVIATIKYIAFQDDNSKKMLGENPDAIPLLIKALETGNTDTRTQAIKAINALYTVKSNNLKLSELGVIEALVHALEENEVAESDVFEALFKLCEMHAARLKVLQVILDPIRGQKIVGRMLPFLEKLSKHQDACNDMCKQGAVCCLLGIIRESTDPSHQEISVTILSMISFYKRLQRFSLREIREDEEANHTISQLVKDGTQVGQRKAQNILDLLGGEPKCTISQYM